jgi:hypothetical protein
MTRFHRFLLLGAILVAASAPSAHAALDDQDTVYAVLNVAGSASLSIQPKNVSDNANSSNMSFNLPAPGETLALSNQYMEITFNTNFDNWKIKTRTNSGQTPDGSNFWGALVGPDTNYKVYLRWKVADVHAVPALTSGNWNTWTLYKDPADPDYDYNSNYINIANGGSWDGGWAQLPDGTPCTSPVYVYVAGNTPGAPPGTYQNQLYFDLIHL